MIIHKTLTTLLTDSKISHKNNVLFLNEFTKDNFSKIDAKSRCKFSNKSMNKWFKKYSKVSTITWLFNFFVLLISLSKLEIKVIIFD